MNLPVDLNGIIQPESEALIPANCRAVAYGEGCFETIRSYKGKFLRLEAHIKRMNLGLQELGYSKKLHPKNIKQRILRLIDETGFSNKDCRIRIQAGALDKPGTFVKAEDFFTLITANSITYNPKPVTLAVSEMRRIPSRSLNTAVKWSQYASYLIALRKAKAEGFDDAVLLTHDGFISETTIANLFWINGEIIYTPSLSCDILPGITRAFFLDVLQEESLQVIETKTKLEELLNADSAFITNSIREFQVISKIGEKTCNTDTKILAAIKKAFEKKKERELC
jgi:branched-subunit amino acid aminotransferase/4-amino-4-deoxychorismate lyase